MRRVAIRFGRISPRPTVRSTFDLACATGGNTLSLVDTEPSGGTMPVSIANRGALVYVLNAGGVTADGALDVRAGAVPDLQTAPC
jgi:hypothetical protein